MFANNFQEVKDIRQVGRNARHRADVRCRHTLTGTSRELLLLLPVLHDNTVTLPECVHSHYDSSYSTDNNT